MTIQLISGVLIYNAMLVWGCGTVLLPRLMPTNSDPNFTVNAIFFSQTHLYGASLLRTGTIIWKSKRRCMKICIFGRWIGQVPNSLHACTSFLTLWLPLTEVNDYYLERGKYTQRADLRIFTGDNEFKCIQRARARSLTWQPLNMHENRDKTKMHGQWITSLLYKFTKLTTITNWAPKSLIWRVNTSQYEWIILNHYSIECNRQIGTIDESILTLDVIHVYPIRYYTNR